jgi:hypothetical protein
MGLIKLLGERQALGANLPKTDHPPPTHTHTHTHAKMGLNPGTFKRKLSVGELRTKILTLYCLALLCKNGAGNFEKILFKNLSYEPFNISFKIKE